MSAAGLQRVELDVASPSKNLVGHEAEITLPNVNRIHAPNGSVMWAEPDPKGAGARRAGPYEPAKAVDVTPEPAAQQAGEGGPSIAADLATSATPAVRKESLARDVVTEKFIGGEAASKTKSIPSPSTDAHIHSQTRLVSEHATPVIGRIEAIAILAKARSCLHNEDVARLVRKDTPASHKTLADYVKKCRQVDAEIETLAEPWGEPLLVVMCRHAPKKQTFASIRAALKWRSLQQLRDCLEKQDVLRRAAMDPVGWLRAVQDVRTAAHELELVLELNCENCLQLSDQKPRASRSKKKLLSLLKEGWQDRFLLVNESSPRYRLAGVLLRHCGLRPVELQNGVELKLTALGIQVQIVGGKVRPTAGQPHRSFILRADLLPEWFVKEVDVCGVLRVIAQPDALRAHLARLTEAVVGLTRKPQVTTDQKLVLSAYVFRHSIVTELREAGWDSEDIASVIGESAAATVRWYGTRSRTNARTPKTVALMRDSIQVARPVRSVDRSGLGDVLRAKSIRRATVKLLRP
ncbi:MAG: hypothetical protein V9G29_12175 [Burkholderiaceae bacterium]